MFGYITVWKPELKIKDFYKYRSYYCGLCRTLKEKYNITGQMTLSYDMTFVILLLSSLYERETLCTSRRCVVHPGKKHEFLQNCFTEYAADMNILLTYYHFLDDWHDDQSASALLGARMLRKKAVAAARKYPRQSRVIRRSLKKLSAYEAKAESNLDLVSGCFGHLMGELFVWKKDEWEPNLRRFGFFLGKFIYIMDAYEDLPEDLKKNRYNPLIPLYNGNVYEETCLQILTMMMGACSLEFEKLPCLQDADILRNILYGGVWTRYHKIQEKQKEKKEESHDK